MYKSANRMTAPVLATKLFPPPLRPDRVSRPRLLQQLRQGVSRKLTLVSAPAGFGKTTVVSDWLATQSSPFVWYQLDTADSDPARFMLYLLTGIRQHVPQVSRGLEALFQDQQLPSAIIVFTELINQLTTIQDPLVLVLDDYHRLDSPYIDEGISFLLDNQPAHLHLVILTREDPDLPLARLRGRGMLTEIRASHLRFTSPEIQTFLGQTMGLSLNPESIKQLDQRTEGWVAGLQLAGLSLVGRNDTTAVIDNFHGDDRYIVDYLMTEVLHQQDDDMQAFLLKTSILEALSAPLCDELTDRNDSKRTLQQIESANLFLVPLDNKRQWYRYHHLFADLLRHQLRLQYVDQTITELHRQASQWYREQDDFLSAIHHAFQIDDMTLAGDLIADYRMILLRTGEWFTLGRLLRRLPPAMLESHPELAVSMAWIMLSTAKMTDLSEYIKELSPRLTDPHHISEIAILQGYLMLWRNQPAEAIHHSQRALDNLDMSNDFLHSFALNNLGFAYRAANRLNDALEVFQEVQRLYSEKQDIVHIRITVNALANIYEMRGDLTGARQVYQNALDHYLDRGLPKQMLGLIHIGLGKIYYEWNELDLAEEHFTQAMTGWTATQLAKEVMQGHLHLAFVYQAQGKIDDASHEMQTALDLFGTFDDDAFNIFLKAYQARLYLLQGKWNAVEAWANNLPLNIQIPDVNDFTEYAYLTLIRWWLKDNKTHTLQQAQFILQLLLELADETGRNALKAEALLLSAILSLALGEASLAMDYLVNSLRAGNQFKRLYLNEWEALHQQMHNIAKRDDLPTALMTHVHELLEEAKISNGNRTSSHSPSLADPLTERELDVLVELAAGKSNQQIANELIVSIGTVKTHARHIYEKLAVNNRTHAVAKARELGLLE